MESNHKSGDGLSGTQKEAALRALVQRTGYSLVQVGSSCDLCWDPALSSLNGGNIRGPKMQNVNGQLCNSWRIFVPGGMKLHHFSVCGQPCWWLSFHSGSQLHLSWSFGSRICIHSHWDYRNFKRTLEYMKSQLEFTTQGILWRGTMLVLQESAENKLSWNLPSFLRDSLLLDF